MLQMEPADEDPDPNLQILSFSSYDDIKPHWDELNRTYKGDELVLDWAARQLVWAHFYRPRRYELKILVFRENGRCTAIFPFLRPPRALGVARVWDHCDDMLLAQEYFCPPERIADYAPHLPPHVADDMSCFYRPPAPNGFAQGAGTVIDLMGSREEYLASLTHSHRQSLRRTLRANEDLRIETDTRVRRAEIRGILRMQIEYWRTKADGQDPQRFRYSRDKINTDLRLMKRAEEMGRLLAVYIYAGTELVAANFSVRREHDRVDDYLCLRNSQPPHAPRGLGILAILENMEYCRSLGIRYYDLSSCRADYKRKFVNAEMTFFYLPYASFGEPDPAPARVPARRRRRPNPAQTVLWGT